MRATHIGVSEKTSSIPTVLPWHKVGQDSEGGGGARFVAFAGRVWFAAGAGDKWTFTDQEPWVTDGTTPGTQEDLEISVGDRVLFDYDSAVLSPSATADAIDRLCAEARSRSLFSVCVNPCWVARAKRAVVGSEVAVCTVIGFPLGANASASKADEARRANAEANEA